MPDKFIPYGRQCIEDDDIEAVVEILKSDWLTTGPKVSEFEDKFCSFAGSQYAVAVSSGTAALHCAAFAAGIKPGDEVIVTPMTFAATANVVLYQGGIPVFADIEPDTLLIDPEVVRQKITSRTRAIICMDYGGQPCDYDELKAISTENKLILIADSCHSADASYKHTPTGTLADITAFSFHPVKHITTGEGGMVTTNNPDFAERARRFRNHGITTDHRQRSEAGTWYYQMIDLGFNYRISDFQCALGMSQLKKLKKWVDRRNEIAARYNRGLSGIEGLKILRTKPDRLHSFHLYVVKIKATEFGMNRNELFNFMRKNQVGVNVHYVPVHLHPFYRKTLGTEPGMCPVAEETYEDILSLPMYPTMTDEDVEYVIKTIWKAKRKA